MYQMMSAVGQLTVLVLKIKTTKNTYKQLMAKFKEIKSLPLVLNVISSTTPALPFISRLPQRLADPLN